MDAILGGLASLAWARGEDAVLMGNDFLSFVAISGDAHQAKVAQDLFRQEVRYERSLQIREDIRDVNKCMMESVQTHVLMGSIILAVCFSMSIEGFKGIRTERLLDILWLLFTCWASTFTFVALWLALRFQMKISGSARERLLRRHRFMVPDDVVVGKMGGENLVNQMADFHSWVLTTMEDLVSAQTDEETLQEKCEPIFLRPAERPLRVRVQSLDDAPVDAEPLRKGLHAWLHEHGEGYSQNKTLEVPYFLLGETCVRMPWVVPADGPSLKLRVYGEATLYVSTQCIPGDAPLQSKRRGPAMSEPSSPTSPMSAAGVRKALRLESMVPAWPSDELPLVRTGFNEKWRGESGYGEFRRVEGFSIFVDMERAMELPLYKIVLASPADFGSDYIDVVVQWNFKTACEALTVVLRRGLVHCKEEDFPLAEFNTEVKKMLPVRRYAGDYLASGTICLLVATSLLFAARVYNINSALAWWGFEVFLIAVALLPGCVLLRVMPVEAPGEVMHHNLNTIDHHDAKPSLLDQFKRTMSGTLGRPATDLGRRRQSKESGDSDELSGELDEEQNYSTDLAHRLAAMEADRFRLGERDADDEEDAPRRPPQAQESEFGLGCLSPESAPCRDVIRASSDKVSAVATSCQNVWRVPPETVAPKFRRKVSSQSDPHAFVRLREPETYKVSMKKNLRALWNDLQMGLERPRSLQFWTAFLHVLFSLSILSAIAVRLVLATWPEGGSGVQALSWEVLPTEWPTFFQPSAAELVDNGLLFAASDGILQKFEWAAGIFLPVGPALAVPGTARGLGLVDGHLGVISDEGYFGTKDLDESWINSTLPSTSSGPLGILEQGLGNATLFALLPSAERLAAAALSGSSGTSALILGTADGSLSLCRLPATAGQAMDVVLELKLGLEVQGLRLCRSTSCRHDQAVIWAADVRSQVWAVSLESGETLAKFPADQQLEGSLVGLTGNSSHLVALVQASHGPQLVATPYPVLPSASLEL
ncbi:unnamed protein product [Effrenium voratum]|nr:unnamed protein product [Effrenium voratum]